MDSTPEQPGAWPPPGEATVRWPRLLAILGGIQRFIDAILATICVVAFVGLVFIVTWQVFTREILNHSAPWTEEAARQTFILLSLIAIAYVFSERGHIAVTILARKLPFGGQRSLIVLIEAIVIFFIVFVFIDGGLKVAASSWNQSLSILPINVGQTYLMLPAVGVLIIFYSINHVIKVLAGAEKPFPVIEDSAEPA